MDIYENDNDTKKLYIADFQVWQVWDNAIHSIDRIIINAIDLADGVYIFRRYAHLLDENDFVKWLRNEKGLIYYKDIILEFTEDNIVEKFVPRNNERVYFLKFDKVNKEIFLEKFKISIRDIKNKISKEDTIKYLEQSIYIDDPLYDQYDFIFTVGNQVIMFTDIHDFTFVEAAL